MQLSSSTQACLVFPPPPPHPPPTPPPPPPATQTRKGSNEIQILHIYPTSLALPRAKQKHPPPRPSPPCKGNCTCVLRHLPFPSPLTPHTPLHVSQTSHCYNRIITNSEGGQTQRDCHSASFVSLPFCVLHRSKKTKQSALPPHPPPPPFGYAADATRIQ